MLCRKIGAVAFLCMTGCATATQYTQWPYHGPMMMVRNRTVSPLVSLARDGTGRELIAARINPNGKQCFRWPFINSIGYLVATQSARDTVITRAFHPWAADGWEWWGQPDPVSNPNVCR
jgi:hypothetical protein